MSQPEIHPASDQSGPAALQLSRADRKARGTLPVSSQQMLLNQSPRTLLKTIQNVI